MTGRELAPVAGSERELLPGSRNVGSPPPDKRIEITVIVRPRSGGGLPAADESGAPARITHEEYEARHGADPADVAAIVEFAAAHGLDVVETSIPRRTVVLGGTISAMARAFGTELALYEHPGGLYRGRTGPVHVPTEIAPAVEAVLGLDDRPQASPHFRVHATSAATAAATPGSFTPPQLAQLYDFPSAGDGKGQRIAIIELGGGYKTADLTTYFRSLGIPAKVTAVGVDGGRTARPRTRAAPTARSCSTSRSPVPPPRARRSRLLRPQHGPGLPRRDHHGRARPAQALGHLHQLGRPRAPGRASPGMKTTFPAAWAIGVSVWAAAGDHGSATGIRTGKTR